MMNINFDLPYEGYLWMSNKNHPCVYCPEALIDRGLFDGHNPFVTEGYLFNHEKGISISIKYVDGRYRYLYRQGEAIRLQQQGHGPPVLSHPAHGPFGCPVG